HHALGVHAASQHVAMIAVAGDDLVALLDRELHADDDSFLTNVEVAESADQAHAIKLAGLLLEAADQQHTPIGLQLLFLAELGHRGLDRRLCGRSARGGRLGRWFIAGNGHFSPRGWAELGEAAASPIAEIAAGRKRMGTTWP